MIAASIRAENIDEILKELNRVKDVDLMEIRADYLKELNGIERLAKYRDKIIITIRRTVDNGEFNGTEEERLELFKKFLKIKPKFVDIEINSEISDKIIELAGIHGSKVIISYHNFTETPPLEKLMEIGDKMIKSGADVVKIVTYARKIEDNLTILKFVSNMNFPTIAFCMGGLGKLSRIFSPLFGSFLMFASTSKGKETAPGQLTVNEIKTIWRMIR